MTQQEQELLNQITRFRGFLELDPDNTALLIDIANLEHRAGRLDESEQLFRKVLEIQPDSKKALSNLGNLMLSRQEFGEAEGIFNTLLQSEPESTDPVLLHNLGIALAYQDRWEDALNSFTAAHDSGLADPENLILQAYCLINLNRSQEAGECIDAALVNCNDDRLLGQSALLQMEHFDFVEAVKTAKKALAHNPDNIDAKLVTSSWLLETQEVDDAEPQVNQILAVDPDNHRALLSHALIQMYNLKIPDAIKTFERVLELTPRIVGTWVGLGWAHIANNDLPQAEATFQKALEIDRNFGESHGGLATVYALQGRLDDSRREAKLATGLNKGGFGAVYANSLVLEQRGKHDVAARLLGGAFLRRPGPNAPTLIDAIAKYSRRQPGAGQKRLPRARVTTSNT